MSVWTRQCLGCHIWNIPQLVQGRIAPTHSVASLLYRETHSLSLQRPPHQIIVSAAHHPGHNTRPVLGLLLFYVSKMLAFFFFQRSPLSWEKFQYHVSWFESMTVFVAWLALTEKTSPTLFKKYCFAEVKFDYMGPLITSNEAIFTRRCSLPPWGSTGDLCPLSLRPVQIGKEGRGPDKQK